MITANLNFKEWSGVFGDAKMTTPPLRRLTHHGHIAETGNEPHRFTHNTAVAKKRIKARQQAKKAEPFRGVRGQAATGFALGGLSSTTTTERSIK